MILTKPNTIFNKETEVIIYVLNEMKKKNTTFGKPMRNLLQLNFGRTEIRSGLI